MRLRSLLLCVCGATLIAGDALADGGIETVVVTAEKHTENIQATTLSIQAFTAKQLTDLGIKSSIDLSQFTPNVDIALVAGPGNQPIISIRGVGLNDFDTNNAGPNGVYLDEVYLSSPAAQTFQAFDLDRVEVLKGPQGTLYGRNTSGGAINFISSKPTDELTATFHGEYGNYDTYQLEGAVGGQLTNGLDARVSIVKNGSGGFTRNAFTGTRENGTNNISARAQLLWTPSNDLQILFNVHGSSVANRPTEYRHLATFPIDPGNPADVTACSTPSIVLAGRGPCVDLFGYGTPAKFYNGAFNRRQHLDVHNIGGFVRGDYHLGGIDLVSITSFEHNDKLHPEDSDTSPNRLLEINFGVRSETFTQELRATQTTDDLFWVAGLYYLGENLHQNQPLFLLLDFDTFFGPGAGDVVFPPAGPPIPTSQIVFDENHQYTNSYGLYGQAEYKLDDRWKLIAGIRGTAESKSFRWRGANQFQSGGMDHFLPPIPLNPPPGQSFDKHLANQSITWRVGADYKFSDEIHAYASVATGFKSGGFNGSFLNATPDPVQVEAQLQPIKPETVTAVETGLKSTFFDDRLLFNGAFFYYNYINEQVFELVPLGPLLAVNVLTNAKHAHTIGGDFELIAKPVDDLTLSAQLGLLNAKIDSAPFHNHNQSLAPHVTLSTLVDYRVPFEDGHLDFQFGANFKSHQFFDIGNSPFLTQRSYWLENARVGYAFDDDKWEVAAFVRNLSGQKYFVDIFDLSFVGFYQGILGNPRTFGGELNFHT